MTPSQRKQKGKNFETKIANMIHEHLLENVPEYKTLFEDTLGSDEMLRPKRDFSSGVFLDSDGDINLGIARKLFPFSIECKHHKDLDISLDSLLKGKITKLIKIFEDQAETKAGTTKGDLEPLLVFRSNRTSDFVMFREDLRTRIFKDTNFSREVKVDNYIIILFKEFLDKFVETALKRTYND